MEIAIEKNGTKMTAHLSGDLNTLTAPDLSDCLDTELDGVQTLTLDFAECDYVSSAGLRELLATLKQMKVRGGSMEVINVGENFRDVLAVTGLDAVFGVF